MITAAQLRASRALLGIDQRELAAPSGFRPAPTIQRMEASEGVIRGTVELFVDEVVGALDVAGIELIGEGMPSQGAGGRRVRLREPVATMDISSRKSPQAAKARAA